jgi:hypothetical protein
MSLSACPDCGASLGRNASKCRCGWVTGPAKSEATGGTPCAADPSCRYYGRLWNRNLLPHQRICVDHHYIAINQDTTLANCPTIPPAPIRTLIAKPVAGRD